MAIDERYIEKHKAFGYYALKDTENGYRTFNSNNNWTDNIIDGNLIYSHRKNKYTRSNFTEGLHSHEYYELIVYVRGEVEYVKDDILITPEPYSVIWFLPGQMHTARLRADSEYERYVFYFSKEFFAFNGIIADMSGFTENKNIFAMCPDSKLILGILNKINSHLESGTKYSGLLAKTYITELFGILNTGDMMLVEASVLNDDMMQIKNYIDKNYATISSVYELAEKFHYSREHISRTFKENFNISISGYIAKRRISESIPLLSEMGGAEASYAVGFKSQSSFIRAFAKNMGCLPREYKNKKT